MNSRSEGFSLVELLVVVLIATFVLGAIYQTVVVQERGSRQQLAIINTHQTNRTVSSVLATELREISAANGDLLDATETSITFRALRKVGFVCAKNSASRSLTVGVRGAPFVSGASGSAPDVVLVFWENEPETRTDDRWLTGRKVTDASAATPCGAIWPDADATQELTLDPFDDVDFDGVLDGAPVRSYEHLTYRIEQVDGSWVLVRVNEGLAEPPVVLIGPLSPIDQGGLRFTYFRADGSMLTAPLSASQREEVARIQMSVKGMSRSGAAAGQLNYADSLVTQITLRGN